VNFPCVAHVPDLVEQTYANCKITDKTDILGFIKRLLIFVIEHEIHYQTYKYHVTQHVIAAIIKSDVNSTVPPSISGVSLPILNEACGLCSSFLSGKSSLLKLQSR